jgi:hypothetical protein
MVATFTAAFVAAEISRKMYRHLRSAMRRYSPLSGRQSYVFSGFALPAEVLRRLTLRSEFRLRNAHLRPNEYLEAPEGVE